MPGPSHPLRRDYFVYSMAAEGQSFYVGIGRSARASDRVRFVKYLLARDRSGHPVKWVLSNVVIAKLLRAGFDVKPKVLRGGLTRPKALDVEARIIEWFRRRGVLLANQQLNGGLSLSADLVVQDVRRRIARGKKPMLARVRLQPNPLLQRTRASARR